MTRPLEKPLFLNCVFVSVEGEVTHLGQGVFTTFIRLQGCNLRCSYCDTQYSQELPGSGKEPVIIRDLIRQIRTKKVTITGGEPLMQENVFDLIQILLKKGHIVTVETNGTIKPPQIYGDKDLGYIFDYKLPSSGMEEAMMPLEDFSDAMNDNSILKFVISDDVDFNRAVEAVCSQNKFMEHYRCAFSPALGKGAEFTPAQLVNRMRLEDLYFIRFNLQIHKFIWPNAQEEGIEV
jgi:7-carboxy-7-deazaguanine synthase